METTVYIYIWKYIISYEDYQLRMLGLGPLSKRSRRKPPIQEVKPIAFLTFRIQRLGFNGRGYKGDMG